jgi:hypothetical protein
MIVIALKSTMKESEPHQHSMQCAAERMQRLK